MGWWWFVNPSILCCNYMEYWNTCVDSLANLLATQGSTELLSNVVVA